MGWGSKLEGLSKSYFHPKVRKNTKEFSKFFGSRRQDQIDMTAVRDKAFYVDKASCSCCVVVVSTRSSDARQQRGGQVSSH